MSRRIETSIPSLSNNQLWPIAFALNSSYRRLKLGSYLGGRKSGDPPLVGAKNDIGAENDTCWEQEMTLGAENDTCREQKMISEDSWEQKMTSEQKMTQSGAENDIGTQPGAENDTSREQEMTLGARNDTRSRK